MNSRRYHIFFSLWCAIPSGRVLRKRSFALVCLGFFGSCVAKDATSSAGESVLLISEFWAASHRVSMVHISSILLSSQSCPMDSSPSTEGKFHPFGAAASMPLWRVLHVA